MATHLYKACPALLPRDDFTDAESPFGDLVYGCQTRQFTEGPSDRAWSGGLVHGLHAAPYRQDEVRSPFTWEPPSWRCTGGLTKTPARLWSPPRSFSPTRL